ncbi:unnamed protein product [Calypogeia fissa]
MKSPAIAMGAVPGWVVGTRGGRSRLLTFRIVCAAQSHLSAHIGCSNHKLLQRLHHHHHQQQQQQEHKPVSIGIITLKNNGIIFAQHPLFPCRSSILLMNPRHQHHLRQQQQLQIPHQFISFGGIFNSPFSGPQVKATRCLQSARNGRAKSRGGKGSDLLKPGDSKYIDWWEQKMNECQKPSTRELIKRLVSHNLLGLNPTLRNGSLKEGALSYDILEIKRRFPHEVILTRVGEFYEASGFDACVLAEYAGLNPMGGLTNSSTVPRAGCPIDNLRQTLDALTRNGFSVCIVEEVKGPANSKKRKERFVAGHAHPGSPYVYGLAEADFDVDFPDPVSIIGIARSASGYCLISVVELMRSITVEDQLTEEAVVAKLRAKPFQRLFLHKSLRDQSTETVRWGEFGEGGLLWAECRSQNPEWYEADPVAELLSKVRDLYDMEGDAEFRRIVSPPGERPRPLNVGTASQVGILPTQGVPSLLRVLFPPDMNGLCIAYLRDLLLNPPPYRVAACIQQVLRHMIQINRPVPDFQCVSAAKLVKLIGAKEANHLEFARIKHMAEDVLLMENDPQLKVLLGLLLDPTWLATGLRLERDQLIRDCNFLVERLDDVLAPAGDPSNATSRTQFVPDEFFDDMEVRWKARVRREHVEKAYSDVDRAAASLSDAIEADFHPIVLRIKAMASPIGGGSGGACGEISYSLSNRAVWFKGKRFLPTMLSGGPGEEEIKRLKEAKDGKGKKVGEDWYTTERVDQALEYYRSAVERASDAVLELLRDVSEELQCTLNAIVFITTLSIIAKTMFAHAGEAKRRRWVVPILTEDFSDGVCNGDVAVKKGGHASTSIRLKDMFPYWLDRTQDQVVLNSIDLESMVLLTGPNGGGKSSILRSVCAATLLATCGLMVPCRVAVVPRLDYIMLRMMIADSPADSKSSFQMEMSELRTILNEATEKSLVLVDELCKGTEVNKGTFIVASVLEHLDQIGCLGVISTHLHGLLDMDLNVERVVRKAMGVQSVGGQLRPTWKLVDGECRESLAFDTARKEGVAEKVVRRAEEFYQQWKRTLEVGIMGQDSTITDGNSLYVDVSIRTKGNLQTTEMVSSTEIQNSTKDGLEDSDTGLSTEDAEDLRSRHSIATTTTETPLNGYSSLYSLQVMELTEDHNLAMEDDLQHVLKMICKKKLSDLYGLHSGKEGDCQCYAIGPRQTPPPMITNQSCVYILKRPDGKLYVGQTDNMSGRMERHRSAPGLHEAPFLFIPLHNKSVACELETYLIKQLPSYGFSLVNRGDQNHRYFGTASLIENSSDEEDPPF